MRSWRTVLLCACVLSISAGAWGQTATPLPKIEPALDHIPAGAMGYVVIRDLKKSLGDLHDYLAAIGVVELMEGQIPEDLLGFVVTRMSLGEGFNPSGDVAAVMLNPAQFDVDLLQMIGIKGEPAEEPPKEPKLPLVVFVPGKGIAEVFPKYDLEQAGASTKLMSPAGPVFARQCGGYIILSPMDEALDAVLKAKKKTAAELTTDQLAGINRGNVGLYLNLEVIGPLAGKALDALKAKLGATEPDMPVDLGKVLDFYKGLLSQVNGAAITVRLGKEALVLEEFASVQPDSQLGRIFAAAEPGRGGLLDRLPNLPYVLAIGSRSLGAKSSALMTEMTNPLLEGMFKKDEVLSAKFKRIASGMSEQFLAQQLVIGGAPADSGLFGAAVVWKCKDAEKAKTLIADYAKLIREMVLSSVPEGRPKEEVANFRIEFSKGVETVAGVAVDVIEVTHPELAEMGEGDKEEMATVLGEARIRFFLAAPDRQTLVLTFGGSKAFLGEALKVAKGGGTIPADAEVRKVMGSMPRNPCMVLLLNGGNLWKVIRHAVEAMGEELPPFKITTQTPIALGAAIRGSSAHAVLYVPNQLVKEIVKSVAELFAGRAAGQVAPQPPPGDAEDF